MTHDFKAAKNALVCLDGKTFSDLWECKEAYTSVLENHWNEILAALELAIKVQDEATLPTCAKTQTDTFCLTADAPQPEKNSEDVA